MLVTRTEELREFRETGELSDMCVRVDGIEFRLHKFPLVVNSEFFRALCRCGMADEDRVELSHFPGGANAFSLVADYCYGQQIDINYTNVAELRCAAEFLQMTSQGNLASETSVALTRILRSHHRPSISQLVAIITKCCRLGAIANQTDVTSSCFAAVLEIWKSNGKLPEAVIEVLLLLPVEWFVGLIVGARDREISVTSIASLVSEYLRAQVKNQWVGIKESLRLTGEGREEPVISEAEDLDVGEIMDFVLLELPEDAPLSDVMDNEFLCLLFRVAARLHCKCEGILLRAISRKLNSISRDILVTMPTANVISIIDYNVHNNVVSPTLLCDTLDGYLWERVKRNDIALDEFHDMAQVIPKDYRQRHDSLLMIAQELFAMEKPSEETKLKILETIEPHRLHEQTLRLVSEKNVIPSSFIVKSALAVSSRLRNELAEAKAELDDKDKEMRKVYDAVGDVIKGQWENNDVIVNVAPKDARNTRVQFAKILSRNTSRDLSMQHEAYEGKLTLCVRSPTQGLFLFDPFNEHLIEIKRSKYDNLMVGENYQKKRHTTSYWPFNDAAS